MKSIRDLVIATRSQFAGDRMNLRALQLSVQCANVTVRQAKVAYIESCALLERIDGAPNSPPVSGIRIPE
jgi:hypothetical protein